ncbi:MAG TPA: M23 family metallopeptidase [Polyangia bacterium]|nr:M23 family metallopeptidase [Polyangia bacterium]
MTGLHLLVALLAGAPAGPRLRPGRHADRTPPPQVTRLTLPFDGIWGVLQGFDSDETHRGYAAFALDFVPAQRAGTKEPPRGAPLTAWACYGRPVLAPADGTVVAALGTQRDWPAHVEGRAPGNYVILQHAPREYTEFRHLAAGSVTLKVGDRIRRGDPIGRCGNSGNAETPHLHVGFLSSFDPIVTRPMTFSGYQVLTRDGWRPGDGTPRRGEFLRRAPGGRAE